jgi:glycosyltransferase involved in cell wall biosynthesis
MQRDAIPLLAEKAPGRSRSLRIAVVTETYTPEINGVAITAAHFVDGLRHRDHAIQLIRPRQKPAETPAADARFEEILTRGIPIPGYPQLKMGLPATRTLQRLWSAHRPDVVHIVTEGPLGWSALQVATKLALPIVSDFRTNFHAYSQHYGVGWLKAPVLAYLRSFHNRTRATLVPTAAMRNTLEADGFRNIRVISRGVDTRVFTPARRSAGLRTLWGARTTDPVVLHMGRLAPEKDPEMVALAFDAIRAKWPAAKFVVVGDGPSRAGMERRLPYAVFAGVQRGTELARHIASGDVFVFPSQTETYGNVTVEAMACGLAVVAFDYGAASEHIRHGENGLLAPLGDKAAFIAMATDIAGDLSRANHLGANAAADALRLDWNDIVGGLESILLDAAGAVTR